MADEFEWVSDGSSSEEEKNKLPVAVKKKSESQIGRRIAYVAGKAFVILGTLILALLARLLWLLAKVKIPHVKMPDVVKVYFKKFILWLSSIRIKRPSWLIVPAFIYHIKIPEQVFNMLFSGLCFVFILAGSGALFAIISGADSLMNYILLLAGLAATVWLIWIRSAATFVAGWLLQVLRNRKTGR